MLCKGEYLHGWIENPISVYTYLKFTSTFMPENWIAEKVDTMGNSFKNGVKLFALI